MSLKEVVVVVCGSTSISGVVLSPKYDRVEFKADRECLTVHNTPEGLLVINEVDKDSKDIKQLAVFNAKAWLYWHEKRKIR